MLKEKSPKKKKYAPFFIKFDKKSGNIDISDDYDKRVMKKTQLSIRDMMVEGTRAEISPFYFAKNRMGIDLARNQIELVKAICDFSIKRVASLQARQGGKSFGVATGITIAADRDVARRPERGTLIGVFANKEDQAYLIRKKIEPLLEANDYFKNRMDWNKCTKREMTWKSRMEGGSGSVIKFLSASEQAHIEGETFDIIVLDESQKISDHVYEEAIVPMGSAAGAKIIQIGTPRRKNHFYNAVEDKKSNYIVIKHDWTQCPRLWMDGAVYINDKPYSTYVLTLMPMSLRREIFPDNPIGVCDELSLPVCGSKKISVWEMPLESGKGMAVKRFKTQYMLNWLADVDAYLSKLEFEKLASGNFDVLNESARGEVYYAGIDCGGSLGAEDDYEDVAAGSEDEAESHTSISVIRMAPDGRKHKVFHKFLPKDMDWVAQGQHFIDLFHPAKGKFLNVKNILIDIGNVGKPVLDHMKAAGLPIEGIFFQATDKDSRKNFKNAMYDLFQYELQDNKWCYPNIVSSFDFDQGNELYNDIKNSYLQWEDIEAIEPKNSGINKKFIQGNSSRGDDAPNSDVLAGFACKFKVRPPKVKPRIGSRI